MILFLPFAAMLKVVCEEYEELKPIALLIGTIIIKKKMITVILSVKCLQRYEVGFLNIPSPSKKARSKLTNEEAKKEYSIWSMVYKDVEEKHQLPKPQIANVGLNKSHIIAVQELLSSAWTINRSDIRPCSRFIQSKKYCKLVYY